ncbi:hypothetical protein VNO77_01349 [Canavalia gladiata]|uniref:Uncharacterized protein n=1 Tax=Canavalia gladiata TaxID=3824 RepID=A0AAN9R565_CANGL
MVKQVLTWMDYVSIILPQCLPPFWLLNPINSTLLLTAPPTPSFFFQFPTHSFYLNSYLIIIIIIILIQLMWT